MKRVSSILKNWSGQTDDAISLDFQDRHRRRTVLTSTGGMEFILDLADVPDLREGDALRLLSGEIVRIIAAPETLMEITCDDPLHLARIAWHLGNRHLPTQITEQKLTIHADHVIAEMVRGLGGQVRHLMAPFNPEGGAYGQAANAGKAHRHGHHHHHDDDDHTHHAHDHGHHHG